MMKGIKILFVLCRGGGADSDIVLDICKKVDLYNKIKYVWFDTGIEYQATKDHLVFLENKYNINIIRKRAKKTVPVACKEIGQPFLSKNVSTMIERLQKHNFQWEDESIDKLLPKYCKWSNNTNDWRGCKGALEWWCNENGKEQKSDRFNIRWNKWLKEFILENPPTFKISSKCCDYAKKDLAHDIIKENGYDMSIIGVRKAEGGIRATSYKSCFDEKEGSIANYRPLFFWKNEDKKEYEEYYNIIHSKCYTDYKMKRTGCAGCPFGKKDLCELEILEQYEPKLFIAINNIFKDSYEYTKLYREYYKMKEGK